MRADAMAGVGRSKNDEFSRYHVNSSAVNCLHSSPLMAILLA